MNQVLLIKICFQNVGLKFNFMIIPLVSVILPVFNASHYLKDSIESILNQTFIDFELIIIDDGSTDNSLEIIRRYNDLRIKLYLNDINKGIVFTLNKGIELSLSDIIARMDADDISLPDRLEKQYNYLVSNIDCTLVCGWIKLIDNFGVESFTQKRYTQNLYFDMIYECTIPHPTVMFRKDAVLEFGGYRHVVSEDYDLWSRMILKYKMVNIEELVLLYRITDSNLSTVLKNENYTATKTIVRNNIELLIGQNKIKNQILEWFIGDFSNLRFNNNVLLYVESLYKLKKIRNRLLLVDNVNNNNENINKAFINKRNILLTEFSSKLNFIQMLLIYLLSGQFKRLVKMFLNNKK